MNQNNQQPGSADLPPFPADFEAAFKRDPRGRVVVPIADLKASFEIYARDAIAASRRAPSLPDVAMPELMDFAEKRLGLDLHGQTFADLVGLFQQHGDAQPAEGSAQVATDDWKMVPINPTPKMIDATFNDRVKGESHNARNRRIYAAMIAAAPEQASAAVKDPK